MSARDTGGPAFPHQIVNENGIMFFEPGMTMRQYYAGKALPHALATAKADRDRYGNRMDDYAPAAAREAIHIADALIAELSK